MAVYVDDVRHRFGRMVMCHLWADTEAELHDFAAALGLKRAWFQQPPKASWKHYDISLGVKVKAVAAGAILTDKYGPVEHTARLTIQHSSDAGAILRAHARLDQISTCRAKWAEQEEQQREG